jgi:Cu-Zn family superoxide dismutase
MRHGRELSLMTAAVAVAAATVYGQGLRARADVKGDKVSATIELREIDLQTAGSTDAKFSTGTKGVEITVTATGLTPGAHGLHLHEVGKCEAPGFTTAGGHFDPGPQGLADPDANHPYHMGDLPNLVADASGRATLKATTTRVTLSPGPLSLFDTDGTAIIIHGNPDQGATGAPKSGVSGGPRVACGVIQK